MLAFAGLSDNALDQLNSIGWFLPFFALVIPVALVLFVIFGNVSYLLLSLAQAATIIFALRHLHSHLRRQGFSSYQVRITLAPCYLVACFTTNIVALIGVGIIRKFF